MVLVVVVVVVVVVGGGGGGGYGDHLMYISSSTKLHVLEILTQQLLLRNNYLTFNLTPNVNL